MSSTAATSPRGTGRGQRVTIADIAQRAGVTPAAVSQAVNGRPGVSDATRARDMDIARELHWEQSPAARALAGATVPTVGIVLTGPAAVTSAAVSLAVNGRPGVSDATRARVMDIARELHWEPSHAARALAGAPVLTVGMVLARPADVLGAEAFFGAFVAGLQEVLSAQ